MAGADKDEGTRPEKRVGDEDPFATPESARRADRRLRGRLLAPVTVWTAATGEDRAGLTVSSLVVAEGEPAQLFALVDPLSELHRLAAESGRVLVHVLGAGEEKVAAFFAGRYPVDPFEELAFEPDEYGPRLAGERTTVRARFASSEPAGFQNLLRATVDSVLLATGGEDPLAWYRGGFRRLSS